MQIKNATLVQLAFRVALSCLMNDFVEADNLLV